MYIEVEGKTYYLSIRDSEKNVTIIGQKGDIIHLAVSAQLPHAELMAYLKSTHVHKIATSPSAIAESLPSIDLFDTTFELITQKNLKSPYIKGKVLYSGYKADSQATQNKLLKVILLQELKKQIGFWEETLNVLVSHIYIRKLKTNSYTFCVTDKRLTFDKNLVYRTKDYIAYICAVAIFDYLALNDSLKEQLLIRHVKNWMHHRRVLAYEATSQSFH